MRISLCVLSLVAAVAVCVEGLLWVRATHRQLDLGEPLGSDGSSDG